MRQLECVIEQFVHLRKVGVLCALVVLSQYAQRKGVRIWVEKEYGKVQVL